MIIYSIAFQTAVHDGRRRTIAPRARKRPVGTPRCDELREASRLRALANALHFRRVKRCVAPAAALARAMR